MRLRSGIAFAGALVSTGAMIGLYVGLGLGWIALLVVVGLAAVSYVVAAVGAASAFGEFMRGWLIGLNAGLNAVLAFAIIYALGSLPAGIAVGATLGILNFLSVFAPISHSEVFQGFMGWMNWLMPMSWLIVALGVLFTLFSLLLWGVTAGRVAYLRIVGCRVDWATGTFFIKGGLIANLNPLDTAFNMGNFSFVDRASRDWHIEHEAGHTLNLAAFGSLFHLIGALDENATRRGANALSERIAESNHSGTSGSNIPMWA